MYQDATLEAVLNEKSGNCALIEEANQFIQSMSPSFQIAIDVQPMQRSVIHDNRLVIVVAPIAKAKDLPLSCRESML